MFPSHIDVRTHCPALASTGVLASAALAQLELFQMLQKWPALDIHSLGIS